MAIYGHILVFAPSKLKDRVGAKYDGRTDILWLPDSVTSKGTPENQGEIVHECVHAAIDLQKVALTTATSEVAAYLVQTIFHESRGVSVPAGNGRFATVHQEARSLVAGALTKPAAGRALRPADYEALRRAIVAFYRFEVLGSSYTGNEIIPSPGIQRLEAAVARWRAADAPP